MTFKTIEAPADGRLTEKMSRFLAFAMPVSSVGEARDAIAAYTARYHDARHVCWAYTIGADRATWQCSDNGEPSGTAGKPILGQINSLGLTDVVVIVVRYFGGIKLGTGGLIVAYREAARAALDAATIVEREEMATVTLRFGYLELNDVMRLAKQPGVKILSQDFDNTCTLRLSMPVDLVDRFSRYLAP